MEKKRKIFFSEKETAAPIPEPANSGTGGTEIDPDKAD